MNVSVRKIRGKLVNYADAHPLGMFLRATAGILVVSATLATLASCGGKTAEPFEDAGRGQTFSERADTVTMPDGFSNLATKCGPGGMRYTVAFHGDAPYGAISVVPDPSCR
jgi:hypothetical protein